MARALHPKDVFINCPFDTGYRPIFDAIVFAVIDLGFVARCALEADDGAEQRLNKIERIVEQCRFGIHDLSAVTLDPAIHLPRFNMPLELGLFMGCRRFGGEAQREKISMILDSEQYRYRQFASDLAGQDIHAHRSDPEQAIREVRNWLSTTSRRKLLPGGSEIVRRYRAFRDELPALCQEARLVPDELTFSDLSALIVAWLKMSR